MAHRLESVNSPAAVFSDVEIISGVHRDTMRLVELTRQMSPFCRSTWMLAGAKKRAAFEFSGVPLRVRRKCGKALARSVGSKCWLVDD